MERACLYFTHFLQQRDYDGKLRFNHDKQKLEIQVNPVCTLYYASLFAPFCKLALSLSGPSGHQVPVLPGNQEHSGTVRWREILHHRLLHHVAVGRH